MQPKKPNRGFTLIEMAIVLVIVGLLAGLTLPVISDLIKREKRTASENFLENVKEQIIGYALINDALPNDLQADLGIGQDPYGNTIKYRYADGLDTDLCTPDTTDFTVEYWSDGSASSTTNNVAFVIFSIGRNVEQELPEGNLVPAPGSADNAAVTSGTFEYFDIRTAKADIPTVGGSLDPGQEYDDAVEVVTLPLLKTRVCTASTDSGTAPAGSDVSFANNLADGESFVVQSAAQTAGADAIRINEEAGTMEMGAGEDGAVYACQWYQGNEAAGDCTTGVCEWPADGTDGTLRIFFRFQYQNDDNDGDSNDYGEGFTFTVMTDDNGYATGGTNTITDCGAAGGSLGYAGSGNDRLRGPKIGVEVDTRYTESRRDPEQGSDDTQFFNHVAVVYWDGYLGGGADNAHMIDANSLNANEDWDIENADYNPAGGICDLRNGNNPVGDDNVAGLGREKSFPRANSSDITTIGSTDTDYDGEFGVLWDYDTWATDPEKAVTWLEDGDTHSIRIEIARSGTLYDTCPHNTEHRGSGEGREFRIRVWVDSNSANISDLTADLADTAGFYTEQYMYLVEDTGGSQTYYSQFEKFLFGWTYAHGNNREASVIFSDFGINFDW